MLIKQLELSEKNELLIFLRTAYADNPRMSDVSFWDWHFLENPYIEADNLPVWIAKDDNEIVGQLAATPVKLKVGNAEKSAIWILDLVVRTDYRKRGLAKKLVAEAEAFCPLRLGMNTAEQHSTALLEGLGWTMFGKVPRYNKLLYPGEALREISRIKIARRFANAVFAPLRPSFKDNDFEKNLRRIEKFDASFDELWRESAAQWTCAVVRETVFLNWQYVNQPGKKYDILACYENEKLLGYAVLYFRKADAGGALAKAAITDLIYHQSKPIETIDRLLRGSLQIALERRAGALVTDALDSTIEKRLKFFGFGRVKSPLQLLVKSSERREILEDTNQWLVTRGDSDTSVFEQPNL
jgi:GNAT superfamily N-acetyltransferase